jgi:hypothetical protein
MHGRIAMLAIVLCTSSAWAQGVYKHVGPDGRITYSDQPPGSTSVQYKAPPASPATAPAPTTQTRPAATGGDPASGSRAKKAIAGRPGDGRDAAEPQPVDPALEGAVIGVLGIEDLVQRTEKICTETLPTSFKRYAGAAEVWQSRNADLVSRAHRALSETFDASKRQMIVAGISARNDRSLAVVKQAQAAPRIRWCDQSTDEIANGTMDVRGKPKLSAPLLAYNAR